MLECTSRIASGGCSNGFPARPSIVSEGNAPMDGGSAFNLLCDNDSTFNL